MSTTPDSSTLPTSEDFSSAYTAPLGTMPSKSIAITDTLPMPKCAIKIPRLGFGVYQSPPGQCIQSCLTALQAGYRHIDTAQLYANEKEVGEAVRRAATTLGIKREEIFVTTKILSAGGSFAKSLAKCGESVDKIDAGGREGDSLRQGYVDCFLIHSPSGGKEKRKEMWLALEKLYEQGRARSIGVSNYGVGHIEEMKSYAKVWPPHVNQIELHPWCQQREIVAYCQKNRIVVEAYCPLVRNYKANEPTLVEIAKKYNKTTGQVLIRYCLQKNWVPLPKSDNPERIAQNADVYGFDISKEDMATLDGLDQGSAGAIVQAVDN